jgi:hypothetical protein
MQSWFGIGHRLELADDLAGLRLGVSAWTGVAAPKQVFFEVPSMPTICTAIRHSPKLRSGSSKKVSQIERLADGGILFGRYVDRKELASVRECDPRVSHPDVV